MHEGLLIMRKGPIGQVMFCNKPAQKLLMRTIEYHEFSTNTTLNTGKNDKLERLTLP